MAAGYSDNSDYGGRRNFDCMENPLAVLNMEQEIRVKYIDYGTGNRIGNTIYLNRNLKKYPQLHNAILNHEKKHANRFNCKDILIDLQNVDLKGKKSEFYWFIFKHPKALFNFLPLMKIENKWYVDVSLTLFWLFFIFVFVLIWQMI